jgi:ABC-type sugar transport system substrate-binding protein
MGVNAIILAAIDPQSVENVAKQAQDAGIKVIAQSIQIKNCDVYSSADEYDMGYVVGTGAGQWIVDNYGADAEVECAVLNYDSNSSCIPRGDGLQEGILSVAKKAKIVARQDASTVADGQTVTDSLLQANPKLQVIVCQNDSIALGALAAVQSAGKDTKDFYIGGLDNTTEARDKIAAGTALRASLDNIPKDNGSIDVGLCMDLINGKDVDPRYVIDTKLVTYEDVMADQKK